jgi:hypothetical protein
MLLVTAAAQHARRAVLTIEEEEQLEARDESLGSMLDKLCGKVYGTSLNIIPTEVSSSSSSSSSTALAQQVAMDCHDRVQGLKRQPVGALSNRVSVIF